MTDARPLSDRLRELAVRRERLAATKADLAERYRVFESENAALIAKRAELTDAVEADEEALRAAIMAAPLVEVETLKPYISINWAYVGGDDDGPTVEIARDLSGVI
jgi:hypothetical protein